MVIWRIHFLKFRAGHATNGHQAEINKLMPALGAWREWGLLNLDFLFSRHRQILERYSGAILKLYREKA